MMLKSIRARLAVTFSLCLALLMVAAVIGLIWYSRHSTERNADALLAASAQRAVIELQELGSLSELIDEEREHLKGTELAVSLVDAEGHILAKTQEDAPGLSPVTDKDWRTVTAKLKNGNIVVVGMPWQRVHGALRHHKVALISLGAFVVVSASMGTWFLVGRALRPIRLLARQAKASSTDNLVVSLESPSRDHEMMELVDTLNGLLRRLTDTATAKGRFYSAASHELRTPLQALSGHLELALSKDRTKQEYRAAVEETHAQARRLVALVRDLLFLYQLNSSSTLPPREPVDLVDTCKRSLAHFQPLIEERRLHVHLQTPEEAEILASPSHMDMLVRNLVENAVKYASDSKNVHISILAEPNTTRLEILNDCDSPPSWNEDEFYEPFSRPDASRSAKTGGTGLGLAICKAIADANGWRLKVSTDANRVRVSLSVALA